MHRIIIVGGGAGGLELTTRLGNKFGAKSRHKRAQITLVDRNPTHVWKPLLHEVAAGSMDPHAHQLEYIAQAYWHGFRFEQGNLRAIDRTERTVSVDALIDSEGLEVRPARKLPYDTLVIAIGSNNAQPEIMLSPSLSNSAMRVAEAIRKDSRFGELRIITTTPGTEGCGPVVDIDDSLLAAAESSSKLAPSLSDQLPYSHVLSTGFRVPATRR